MLSAVCASRECDPAQRIVDLLAAVERGEDDPATVPLAPLAAALLVAARTAAGETDELVDAAVALAQLLVRKSAALLPRPPAPSPPQPDEPPLDLAALVEEYRQFKAAVEALRAREQEGLRSFPRLAPPPVPSSPTGSSLSGVTLERLLAVVQEALRRRPPEAPDVPRYTVTVPERLAALEAELRAHGRINFHRFIAACRSRIEIIVGFLAVLELIKRGGAVAEQPEPFGDIIIVATTSPVTAD
jgi:segregation and condensation protein A